MIQDLTMIYEGEGQYIAQGPERSQGDPAVALAGCLLRNVVAIGKRRKLDFRGSSAIIHPEPGKVAARVTVPDSTALDESNRLRVLNALKACGVRRELAAEVTLTMGQQEYRIVGSD